MKVSFLKTGARLFLLFILISLLGCATSSDKKGEPRLTPLPPRKAIGKDLFFTAAEQYRAKAQGEETKGDLPSAFESWKVVEGLRPDDKEAREKIIQLQKQMLAAADQHFQRGRAFFFRRSHELARKEFLAALYLNPDHAGASQYLKEKMAGEDFFTYEVKKGDTLKDLAAKFYKDPQKAFVIARLNELKVESVIKATQILRLPVLDSAPLKIPPASIPPTNPEVGLEVQETAGKAREAYQRGDYRESATLAEKSLVSNPENREYREMKNASYYELGTRLGQEKKYEEAFEAFQQVESAYKDRDVQLSQVRKQLAEAHYLQGVRFFIEEEIEEAIQEWERTLTWEPGHPKAKTDIEKGRDLLRNFKKIQ